MWLQSEIVMAIRSQNKISDLASTHCAGKTLPMGWMVFCVSQSSGLLEADQEGGVSNSLFPSSHSSSVGAILLNW